MDGSQKRLNQVETSTMPTSSFCLGPIELVQNLLK